MVAAPSFPRATSQATACRHLATAARVKYLVFGVFDIDEIVSEGVNCFGCVREWTEKVLRIGTVEI